MKMFHRLMLLSALLLLTACATQGLVTPEQKRAAIKDMRSDTLAKLYQHKPDVKAQIASAVGYAVFSNANVNLIFASLGTGVGIARDNRSGKQTYMKMAEGGLGLGLGAKDYRMVFVFHSAESLQRFIDSGWTVGSQADAAAKSGDKGGAYGGEKIIDNVSMYQLTENGLALQATVKGSKYWPDDELN